MTIIKTVHMPAIVFSVYSAFDNCFGDDRDDIKDATKLKLLIGAHHLRYPQPYPLPRFFSTTLPEP